MYPEETGEEMARREEMERGSEPVEDEPMEMPPEGMEMEMGGHDPIGDEEDPPSRPRFRFQSQLPPEERTAYLRSRAGARGGIPPRAGTRNVQGAMPFMEHVTTASHVMDE